MPKQHEITELARAFSEELESDAREIAGQVASELLADTMRVSKPAFLAHVRRMWLTDPAYSQTLLDKLAPKGPTGQRPMTGLKAYLSVAKEAFSPTAQTEDVDPVVEAATATVAQEPPLMGYDPALEEG